jgi:hypothetical protein
MKPNAVPVSSLNGHLSALPATAKVVRHPRAKKIKGDHASDPPSEETLLRLNAMAKQYPFCVLHRGNMNSSFL